MIYTEQNALLSVFVCHTSNDMFSACVHHALVSGICSRMLLMAIFLQISF